MIPLMQPTEYLPIGVLCKVQLVCKSVLMWIGEDCMIVFCLIYYMKLLL